MSKVITIFGATGLQGGSVIRAIRSHPKLSQEFKIRGVTRDVDKPVAKELVSSGVEMVNANMNNLNSILLAIENTHTVFLVTNFEDSHSYNVEVQQGKNVADACKQMGVQHLIFSSLANISKASGGTLTKVLHFDSKAHVEEYIREIGVPATFVLAGSYMQNQFRTIRKIHEEYVMTMPAGDEMRFPLIDVAADYGKFVNIILLHRDAMLGKQIYAAQAYYRPSRIVKELSEIMHKPARLVTLPPEQFQKLSPPERAEDLTEMGQAFASPGYFGGDVNLGESQTLLEDELTTWREFVERNFDGFLNMA